jgi:peptidoglycan/xylan/chitin deacetylase (PgdA/CDA1 family)
MNASLANREWGRRYWLPLLHRRLVPLRDVGPVVSFTFDDFPRTAYRTGGKILEDNGVRGTFYAAIGLMNSVDSSGEQFVLDDLHSVVANGHELASHTCHHVASRSTLVSAFLREVREGRWALQDVSGLPISRNFAYPYGSVTPRTKRAVSNEMLSSRGIYPGVNGQMVDVSLLRANPLYGEADQFSSVQRLIRATEESRGWLIFYTHDVRKSPSAFGCTPKLLESAIKAVLNRSIEILTVDEVLRRARAKRAAARIER